MTEEEQKSHLEVHIKGTDQWDRVVRIEPRINMPIGNGFIPRRYVTEDGTEIPVKAPFVKKRRIFEDER